MVNKNIHLPRTLSRKGEGNVRGDRLRDCRDARRGRSVGELKLSFFEEYPNRTVGGRRFDPKSWSLPEL
jgi:hypothetical protein